MAYIALYRKWRPALFEDVVGQRHITETLQKAIETDKVAHAYLFSGPRGTGKTSTAKIFAKALNCAHGPTPHPCNVCEICRHITNGESLDVVEIDAASNRSIEDIRTLRETIKFMPAEGHKKIYIIDEVHMLTTEAFNALLKTLEEPPSHVVFILATTEPEKIPMTILSRCQRYEFRRITSEDIAGRLLYVAGQEDLELTKGAAHILAVQADGGMRDALSMLDQCVSNVSGTIDEPAVRDLLGLIGRDWLFKLSDAVFENRGDCILESVDEIVRMGKEPRVILTELASHLRAVMLYQAAPSSDTLAAYADSREELARQSARIEPDRVFALLAVLQQALLVVRTSPMPRVAVEMGLLQAARTRSTAPAGEQPVTETVSGLDGLVDRIVRLEQRLDQLQAGAVSALPQAPVYVPLQPAYEDSPAERHEEVPPAAPAVSPVPAAPVSAVAPVAAAATPAPGGPPPRQAAVRAAPVAPTQYTQMWKAVQQDLDRRKKRVVASCMGNGTVLCVDGNEVVVTFKTEFMVKRANKEDYRRCVNEALEALLGAGFHIRVFLESDPDLAEYQKKKTDPAGIKPAPPEPAVLKLGPAEPSPGPAPEAAVPAQSQPAPTDERRTVSLKDMTQEEQDAIKPLLETLGECTIYVENDNN